MEVWNKSGYGKRPNGKNLCEPKIVPRPDSNHVINVQLSPYNQAVNKYNTNKKIV